MGLLKSLQLLILMRPVHNFSKILLIGLLDKSDKHPLGNAKIGSKEAIMRPYLNNKPIGLADEVNRVLRSYALEGLIEISWYDNQVGIRFIRLLDGDRLAEKIGTPRLGEIVSETIQKLDNLFKVGIYRQIKEDLVSQWSQAKPYEGFQVSDATKLIEAIRGAEVVLAHHGEDIDYRHISVSYTHLTLPTIYSV